MAVLPPTLQFRGRAVKVAVMQMRFKLRRTLVAYFRSGWVFLIPYLAAYLLYAWMKWPVNTAPGGEKIAEGTSKSELFAPSLLHLYWLLHAVHLILASIAFVTWWIEKIKDQELETKSRKSALALQFFDLSVFQKTAPWLLLALIFYMPGVYLEWPSDPWEHLRRINEWRILDHVTTHSAWIKSSYFLPYSLTGHTTGLTQLTWLNFYYTASCLLLSWQYYQLARRVGLSARAAYLFVIINTLTFGNNIFSFYRYYGISSTIFAQIGVIASTRYLLALAKNLINIRAKSSRLRPLINTVISLLLASIFAAINHPQSIVFIVISAGAICVWALVEKHMKWTLAWVTVFLVFTSVVAALTLNQELSQPSLTTFFSGMMQQSDPSAASRVTEILGIIGIIHIFAGFSLLRSNHVVGWLVTLPVFLLFIPIFTMPLAYILEKNSSLEMFNRVLLAIPTPLAFVCMAVYWRKQAKIKQTCVFFQRLAPVIILLIVAYLTTAPASYPNYNRFFNSLKRSNVNTSWQSFEPVVLMYLKSMPREQQMFGPWNALFISDAFGFTALQHTSREFRPTVNVEDTARSITHVYDFKPAAGLLLVRPTASTAPTSLSGYLSRHWQVQSQSLDSAGYAEMRRLAEEQRGRSVGESSTQLFLFENR